MHEQKSAWLIRYRRTTCNGEGIIQWDAWPASKSKNVCDVCACPISLKSVRARSCRKVHASICCTGVCPMFVYRTFHNYIILYIYIYIIIIIIALLKARAKDSQYRFQADVISYCEEEF